MQQNHYLEIIKLRSGPGLCTGSLTNAGDMKATKAILGAMLFASLAVSCVSRRKYNEAMHKCDEKYASLETKYQQLSEENKNLTASSSDALLKTQQELAAKEKSLQEKEKKIQELNQVMNSQREAMRKLKQEVCSALKCFTPDELSIEVRGGKLYVSMSDKLLFASGSDRVNERGMQAIQMLAAVLSNSDLEIMVEGHTDNVPISTEKYSDNWDLSVHRSTSVTRLLIENGISPGRIIAAGRGEFHPLVANDSPEGKQANRRTEIVLSPRLDKLWELTEHEDISQR